MLVLTFNSDASDGEINATDLVAHGNPFIPPP